MSVSASPGLGWTTWGLQGIPTLLSSIAVHRRLQHCECLPHSRLFERKERQWGGLALLGRTVRILPDSQSQLQRSVTILRAALSVSLLLFSMVLLGSRSCWASGLPGHTRPEKVAGSFTILQSLVLLVQDFVAKLLGKTENSAQDPQPTYHGGDTGKSHGKHLNLWNLLAPAFSHEDWSPTSSPWQHLLMSHRTSINRTPVGYPLVHINSLYVPFVSGYQASQTHTNTHGALRETTLNKHTQIRKTKTAKRWVYGKSFPVHKRLAPWDSILFLLSRSSVESLALGSGNMQHFNILFIFIFIYLPVLESCCSMAGIVQTKTQTCPLLH